MRSVLFVLFLGIAGCNPTIELDQIELLDLQNEVVHIKPSENAVTVIYFLSPECPLCINYSLALKDIYNQFSNDSVVFYGIHSGKWFSQTEVKEYQLKYGLEFEMCLDNNNHLAQSLGATVTPEVFVLNSNSEIIYSGKIDNWVNDLGKKKLEVSEHYLENALIAWRDGKAIKPNHTKPVGCLIE